MSSIQNQDETQDTHQLLASLEQGKSGIEANGSENQLHHSSNEGKVEEQSKSLTAHQCKKGDEDEKFEAAKDEVIDEEPMTSNDRVDERDSKEKNGGGSVGPRERLKRHRTEVAGHVWIPDMWGQEELLKDWIDCNAFDACLVPKGIMSARASLIEEGRRANSGSLRVENSC